MEDTKGLVIRASGWSIIDVVMADEKAYKKGVESGVLWHILPNGRVLPYQLPAQYEDSPAITGDGVTFVRLEDKEGFYEAEIDVEMVKAREETSTEESDPFFFGSDTMTGARWGRVLDMLVRVVRQRQDELPEGSYTTHLFESGLEKIRKKTGEEAVELILAQGTKRVVSESADLIYHLLVLLAAESISFGDVIKELESRMEKE